MANFNSNKLDTLIDYTELSGICQHSLTHTGNQEKSQENSTSLVGINAFQDHALLIKDICAFYVEQSKQTADNGQRENVYLCNFCSYSVPNIELILEHVKQHRFNCSSCVFKAFSRLAIFQHWKTEHNQQMKSTGGDGVYVCSLVEELLPVKEENEITVLTEFPSKNHELFDKEVTNKMCTLNCESALQQPCGISKDVENSAGVFEIKVEKPELSPQIQETSVDKDTVFKNFLIKRENEVPQTKIFVKGSDYTGNHADSDEEFKIAIERPEEHPVSDIRNSYVKIDTCERYTNPSFPEQQCAKANAGNICSDKTLLNTTKVQGYPNTLLTLVPLSFLPSSVNTVCAVHCARAQDSEQGKVTNLPTLKPNDISPAQIAGNDTYAPTVENESEITDSEAIYWKCAHCMLIADHKKSLQAHVLSCHKRKPLKFIGTTSSMIIEDIEELKQMFLNYDKTNKEHNWYSVSEDTLLHCGSCSFNSATVDGMKRHMVNSHQRQKHDIYAINSRAKNKRIYCCLKQFCCFATQNNAVCKLHTARCLGRIEVAPNLYSICPYCAFATDDDSLLLKKHIISKHSGREKKMTVVRVEDNKKEFDLFFCGICYQESSEKDKVWCHEHGIPADKSESTKKETFYWNCAYCMFYTESNEELTAHVHGCHGNRPVVCIKETVEMIVSRLSKDIRYWPGKAKHNEETIWYRAEKDTSLKCGCCSYVCCTMSIMKDHMLKKHLGQALYALDFRAKFTRVYFCLKKSCCFATQNNRIYENHTPRCIGKNEYLDQESQSLFVKSIQKTMFIASSIEDTTNSENINKYYCCPHCPFYSAECSSSLVMHFMSKHSSREKKMTVFCVKGKKIYDYYFCRICFKLSLDKKKLLCHDQENDLSGGQNIQSDESSGTVESLVAKEWELGNKSKSDKTDNNPSEVSWKVYAENVLSCQEPNSQDLHFGLWAVGNNPNKYSLSVYKPLLEKALLLDTIYPLIVSHMPLDIRNSMSVETLERYLERYDMLTPSLYKCLNCGKLLVGEHLMKQHLREHNSAPSCAVDFLRHKKGHADYLTLFCPVDKCDFTSRNTFSLSSHVKMQHGLDTERKHATVLHHDFILIRKQFGEKTYRTPINDSSGTHSMVSKTGSNQGTKRTALGNEAVIKADLPHITEDKTKLLISQHTDEYCRTTKKAKTPKDIQRKTPSKNKATFSSSALDHDNNKLWTV